MTGYVRTDTTNNIADGNVISAADLDNEFNGVQAAFNSSTGHTHDGSASEGAPITKLGPTQDVTISATVLGVKTTNTVDLGTSSLKFKDFYLAGNALIGGTLGVTGATTLSAALTYGGVTLSNAVTGTGNMVLSASPTLTGTITAAAANFSGAVALNGNATIGDADTDTITQAASYVTGTQLKSAKTATNTLALAAYDVDGTAYTNLITLTASNTPTLALTSTGVGSMDNVAIGATTAATGAFTTLSSTGNSYFATSSGNVGIGTSSPTNLLSVAGNANITGNTTLGDASTDTVTVNGTLGIGGAASASKAIYVQNSISGLNIIGTDLRGTYTSTGGSLVAALATGGGGGLVANSGGAISAYGCYFSEPNVTVTSGSVTNAATVFINEGPTEGGTLNANLYTDAATGTNKWNIYASGTAANYFAGNVGIGTTSPSSYNAVADNLVIGTSGSNGLTIVSGTTNDGSIHFADGTSGADAYRGQIYYSHAANYMVFSTDATERMRIDSSGNLLVGTTSVLTSGKFSLQANLSTANAITMKDSGTTYGVSSYYTLYQNSAGSTVGGIGHTATTSLGINATTDLQFFTAATERARIDSSGNVGIGTSSITANLQIQRSSPSFWMVETTSGTAQRVEHTVSSVGVYNQNLNWNAGSASRAFTWSQGGTENMRIDSSGNLGVGTTSITSRFKVTSSSAESVIARLTSTGSTGCYVGFAGSGAVTEYDVACGSPASNVFAINTSATERARIDTSGNLLVGATSSSTSDTVAGVYLFTGGVVQATRTSAACGDFGRLVNDGDIVVFRQAGTVEGTISVSGTTVSYNGGHLSRWAQTTDPKDESLVKGTVLSNLDAMNVYTDAEGNPVDNEQLNKVKISDTEGDVNVAGVFVNWTHDEAHNVDEINMAMTGDMIIRIAQGVTVARGDLLMSAGDGTAKPQGDDIVRSKTVAKVTSTHVTCTYEDGSYCVPCVLMAC